MAQRTAATHQRSFRLAVRTLELLEVRAKELSDTGNGLAQRILDEGLRTTRHPLITFHATPDRVRRPALWGTRLSVAQIISTVRESGNSIPSAAEYLGIDEARVRAAVEYYAEFTDEVDAMAAEDADFARHERARWERAAKIAG